MRTAWLLALLPLLAAGCRKKLEAEPAKAETPAAAPQTRIDANPLHGADQIRAAQRPADTANGAVHQEEKADVPAQ